MILGILPVKCHGFWDCDLSIMFFLNLLPLVFIILAMILGILPMDCHILWELFLCCLSI